MKTGCLTKIMKKFHCQSHLFLNRPDEQSDIISVQQDALPGLRRERGCKRSNSSAFVNKLIRTSIANIKSMGERGSPWRCPCWFLITSLASTTSSTRVEDVASRFKTRLHQTYPNPKCTRIPNKKGQETESKALDISSFRNILGTCCRWRSVIVCCTKM